MANVKDCPGFETFGEDVRAGRKAQGMTRRALAEEVGVSTRYLANIELGLIIQDNSYEPRPGDIIYFDWDNKGSSGPQDGLADHVGIVEKGAPLHAGVEAVP